MAYAYAELKQVTSLLTGHIRMISNFIIEFERAHNITNMIAQRPNELGFTRPQGEIR